MDPGFCVAFDWGFWKARSVLPPVLYRCRKKLSNEGHVFAVAFYSFLQLRYFHVTSSKNVPSLLQSSHPVCQEEFGVTLHSQLRRYQMVARSW